MALNLLLYLISNWWPNLTAINLIALADSSHFSFPKNDFVIEILFKYL